MMERWQSRWPSKTRETLLFHWSMGWQSGELICQCLPNILQIGRQWGRAGGVREALLHYVLVSCLGGYFQTHCRFSAFLKECWPCLHNQPYWQVTGTKEGQRWKWGDALAMHQQRSPLLQPTSLCLQQREQKQSKTVWLIGLEPNEDQQGTLQALSLPSLCRYGEDAWAEAGRSISNAPYSLPMSYQLSNLEGG